MWTLRSLERAALALLRNPETVVKVGELDARVKEACALFRDRGNPHLRARVDVFQIGFINGVIHELIHVVLRKELRPFDSVLEECAVRIWEEMLVSLIESSKHKTRVWRSAITRKITGSIYLKGE